VVQTRGPQCTLLVYIGDATSRLMQLQFVESESTFDYFAATRAYLERHGKPAAFYSDKHGEFRVNKKDAVGGDGMTQLGRALHALNSISFAPMVFLDLLPRQTKQRAKKRVLFRGRKQAVDVDDPSWDLRSARQRAGSSQRAKTQPLRGQGG
jgi:hypothetical protein